MVAEYVAGFAFYREYVLLVLKNKPEWQKGRLNGIGGKIEPGELAAQAMVREFKEETGLYVDHWRRFCCLDGNGFSVHFFTCELDANSFNAAKTTTDETIHSCQWRAVNVDNAVPNLTWLLPLARNIHHERAARWIEMREHYL